MLVCKIVFRHRKRIKNSLYIPISMIYFSARKVYVKTVNGQMQTILLHFGRWVLLYQYYTQQFKLMASMCGIIK